MYKEIRMLAIVSALILAAFCMLTGEASAGEGSDTQKVSANLTTCYVVREGDTLFGISGKYNITVSSLMRFNGLESTKILVGQKLYLPPKNQSATHTAMSNSLVNVTREELELLARLIHAEARGESFEGKVAVGAVILNRLNSPHFPKTIKDIIMQKTHHVYQFSPVGDGSINLEPDDSSYQAALQALRGDDPTNGALFFYNPEASTDTWIRTLPIIKRIGNHIFASVKA